MKLIQTTILLISAVWCNAQTAYDKKQDIRLYNLENWQSSMKVWQVKVDAKLKADSISIAWLKKGKTADSIRINTLTTQHFNQQTQINNLLSLTTTQANDISKLQSVNITQQAQIWALQDSLRLIPFMIIDTTIHPTGKPSLQFRDNILKVFVK